MEDWGLPLDRFARVVRAGASAGHRELGPWRPSAGVWIPARLLRPPGTTADKRCLSVVASFAIRPGLDALTSGYAGLGCKAGAEQAQPL
jgi:hypothetical protein